MSSLKKTFVLTPNLRAAREPDILSHIPASITARCARKSRQGGGMQEGQRRRDAAAVEDERGVEKRSVRGMQRREQERTECISHPPLCAPSPLSLSPSLSRDIRLNCIYAEECGYMIYARGFNTVAHTVRYCYRISRFPRRMTIICGKRFVPSSFISFFFPLIFR